jgi:hypothetical protein
VRHPDKVPGCGWGVNERLKQSYQGNGLEMARFEAVWWKRRE